MWRLGLLKIQLRLNDGWILIQSNGVLVIRGRDTRDVRVHRKGHTEAMRRPSSTSQGEGLRRNQPYLHLPFGPPASKTVGKEGHSLITKAALAVCEEGPGSVRDQVLVVRNHDLE